MPSPRARRGTCSSGTIGKGGRIAGKAYQFAYVDAVTHFARSLGAARSGNPQAATADIAKLAELREQLRQAKDSYWTEQVDIQWQIATAWVMQAREQQWQRSAR